MAYRDSASYGKRQEYRAVAELLHRGFDVYMTLVDDQGIDCVIRINDARYLDVQIKARSKNIKPKNYGFFPALTVPVNRNNYFFIFYVEKADEYWVISSEKIIELAKVYGSSINQVLTGDNKGKYSVRLTGLRKGIPVPKPRFEGFIANKGFNLLQ